MTSEQAKPLPVKPAKQEQVYAWRSVRRWIERQAYLESVCANSIDMTLVHSVGALVDSNRTAVSDCRCRRRVVGSRRLVRSCLLRRHPAVHRCLSHWPCRYWLWPVGSHGDKRLHCLQPAASRRSCCCSCPGRGRHSRRCRACCHHRSASCSRHVSRFRSCFWSWFVESWFGRRVRVEKAA